MANRARFRKQFRPAHRIALVGHLQPVEIDDFAAIAIAGGVEDLRRRLADFGVLVLQQALPANRVDLLDGNLLLPDRSSVIFVHMRAAEKHIEHLIAQGGRVAFPGPRSRSGRADRIARLNC